MTKPRIESIELLDGEDLESLNVGNLESFSVVVRAMIGPSDGEGEESFDFRVCSSEWINEEQNGKGHFRWLLILPRWDPKLVRRGIMEAVAQFSGTCWQDLALKLSRIAMWEFEGYSESPDADAG